MLSDVDRPAFKLRQLDARIAHEKPEARPTATLIPEVVPVCLCIPSSLPKKPPM